MKKLMKFLKSHKILVLIVALVFFFGVSRLLRPDDPTMGMATVTAELRDITTYNSFVGNVQPASERSILANASERVVEMLVEEGDVVQEGDIIARLDTSTLEYNIARQEISLASTETSNRYNLQDAQRNYANYKEALDAGLNSSLQSAQNQLDNAYYALMDAQTLYNEAKQLSIMEHIVQQGRRIQH